MGRRVDCALQRTRVRVRVRVYSAVVITAIFSYINALNGDFVHDDIPAITRNQDVLGTNPLTSLLINDFWGTPMSDVNSHKSYRPFTTLTFRLNNMIWGLQPCFYHTINVVLHALCCVLFTRVALTVAKLQTNFAAAAGILFAAHPIHTEAVTGIVGRADVLACVFFLLSFLAYHDGDRNRILISSLFATISMLAKETGLTVLMVNVLYDFYKSWPPIKKSVLDIRWNEESLLFTRRAAKVMVVMSVLLVFRLAMLLGSMPKFSSQDNPAAFHPHPHVRLLTYSYLAAFNCWLLLCPSTLSHDWQMGSVPLVTSIGDYRNIATCIFFACFLWVLYRIVTDLEQQRYTPLLLGMIFLVVPFLPATNLIITVGFVIAERVLYIPSLGFVLLIAYGAQILSASCMLRHKAITGCGLLILSTLFCARTIVRNQDWASREALVRAGIKALPHNAKMHYNYANVLRDNGHASMAKLHYAEALSLWPTYASAHNNLGTLMSAAELAEDHFLKAIRFSPGHVNAHYNLGQVYRKMNRTEEAITMLERCLRLNAAYIPAYLLLAKLHDGPIVGRLLYHVTNLYPTSSDYLAEYALWLQDNYRLPEALRYYGRALRLRPDHRSSILGAGRALRGLGQKARLHQLLIRWHMLCRSHSTGQRLVYTGDLYIRSWDFYKNGQTTALSNNATNPKQVPCNHIHMTSLLVTGDSLETVQTAGPCTNGGFSESSSQKLNPG